MAQHHNNVDGEEDFSIAPGTVSWSAQEYVENQKKAGWLISFGVILLGLSILIYYFAGLFSALMVIAIGLIFAFVAVRRPGMIRYELNNTGITVGQKFYPFDIFKSFYVVDEYGGGSLVFTPLKRFSPPLNVFFKLEDEDRILGFLSDFLPKEDSKGDPIDSLMRKIRF